LQKHGSWDKALIKKKFQRKQDAVVQGEDAKRTMIEALRKTEPREKKNHLESVDGGEGSRTGNRRRVTKRGRHHEGVGLRRRKSELLNSPHGIDFHQEGKIVTRLEKGNQEAPEISSESHGTSDTSEDGVQKNGT